MAAQRLDVGFPQKAVISEVFHRGNRCHRFGQTIGVTGVIFGKTIGVTGVTYKYVRIKYVQPNKYVQAVNLCILGSRLTAKTGGHGLQNIDVLVDVERRQTNLLRFSAKDGGYCLHHQPKTAPDSLRGPGVSTAAPSSACLFTIGEEWALRWPSPAAPLATRLLADGGRTESSAGRRGAVA